MTQYVAAGIDPGGSTGLVIARVEVQDREHKLNRIICGTFDSPRDVALALHQNVPNIIYMEKRATHSSSLAGLRAYEQIFSALITLGYSIPSKGEPLLEKNALVLFTPGMWKPFMAHTVVDRASWKPTTQHEKDACNILHFGMLINNPGKKVTYG